MVDIREIKIGVVAFPNEAQQLPLGEQAGVASKLFITSCDKDSMMSSPRSLEGLVQTSQPDENKLKEYLNSALQGIWEIKPSLLVKGLSKISASARSIFTKFTECIALSRACLTDAKEVNDGLSVQKEATLLQEPLTILEEDLEKLKIRSEELVREVGLLHPILRFLVCYCMKLVGSLFLKESSQIHAFLKRKVILLDIQQKAAQMGTEELVERHSIEYDAIVELEMGRRVLVTDLHVGRWLQSYEELTQRKEPPSEKEIKQLGLQAGRALEGATGLLLAFQAQLLEGVLEKINASGSPSVKSAVKAFRKLDQESQTTNVLIALLLFKFNQGSWLKEYSEANALFLLAEQQQNPLDTLSLLNEKIARLEVLAHYRIVNVDLPLNEEMLEDIGVEAFVVDSFRNLELRERTAPILTSLLLGKLKEGIWALSEKQKAMESRKGVLATISNIVSECFEEPAEEDFVDVATIGATLAGVASSLFYHRTFPKGFFN